MGIVSRARNQMVFGPSQIHKFHIIDQQGTEEEFRKVREVIESDGKHTVVDLHLWNLARYLVRDYLYCFKRSPDNQLL